MEPKMRYEPERLPKIVCKEHPEWVEMYDTAWKMAFGNIAYPSKAGWKPQQTCYPNVGIIWQWDSCFMTFFQRFSNGTMGVMNNLDNLYRLQRSDGYLSMAYGIESEKEAYGERINPPLFAWAEWEYYRMTGDDSRFEQVLPRLVRYYDWIKANRTRSSGLYWFEDSGSTGMDNSPRSGYEAEKLNGSDVCFIDLAGQQALSALCIQKMAKHAGQTGVMDRFGQEHETLRRLINKYHWSEKTGFYYDVFNCTSKEARQNFLNHKTVASFWPMIGEVADEKQVCRLVEHILNPDEFWRPRPIPSLSYDDPNYDPLGGYWLGGVWAPTNYMIVKGLQRYRKTGLAREIAVRHLDAMVEVMKNETYASIWECYSPEYTLPSTAKLGELSRNQFVGWSGLGPIAMLIETIFGFDFDAAANSVNWKLWTPGEHGIRDLNFNGRTVSLIAEAIDPQTNTRKIRVETTGKLNLTLGRMGNDLGQPHTLELGRHELWL